MYTFKTSLSCLAIHFWNK
uniref:Uncharacterized protein n=1 Tax=Arundo donax TaxID=35708 RepID=A0A0A9C0C5_ARUDO